MKNLQIQYLLINTKIYLLELIKQINCNIYHPTIICFKKQKKFFALFQSVLDTFNHASLDGLKVDLIFSYQNVEKHIKKLFGTTSLNLR